MGVVAVTSVSNNLNHHLKYAHNNSTGALHYEHYCWEMGLAEVEGWVLSLAVSRGISHGNGSLRLVLWDFIELYVADLLQITDWCQHPNNEIRWPSKVVWIQYCNSRSGRYSIYRYVICEMVWRWCQNCLSWLKQMQWQCIPHCTTLTLTSTFTEAQE